MQLPNNHASRTPQLLSAASNVQSSNRRDRSSIFLLAPGMIIPDSPKHNHEKDQDGPVEVGGIGAGRNGEEHEDEQRGLEREGAVIRRSRSQ
jgi:hypothetical protein